MDDLIKYRLESAKERLDSAKVLLATGHYKDSIGRSYYAIFTAVRAILAKDKVDFSKHAGVIAYFQKEYIKTAVFETKYSKILQRAFQIRNSCDYDDFYIVSADAAKEQYENAVAMVKRIQEFLK